MNAHFNKLTAAELERLAILLEEMGEAHQVIGKILRHGYETHHPDTPGVSNRMLLINELGDVLFAMRMLCGGEGWALDLDWDMIERRVKAKKRQIMPYLHHQATPEAQEASGQ